MRPIQFNGLWWAAIADGVGSSSDGAKAASACIDAVKDVIRSEKSMDHVFEAAQISLIEAGRTATGSSNLSTTLTVLMIDKKQAHVGHVGDTRVTHIRGPGVMARTRDQTEVQKLLDQGALSTHQAKRYPRRHVLLSAMSVTRKFELYQNTFAIDVGDRVLLTSDGLHSQITRKEMSYFSNQSSTMKVFGQAIESEITRRKNQDDATFVGIELIK